MHRNFPAHSNLLSECAGKHTALGVLHSYCCTFAVKFHWACTVEEGRGNVLISDALALGVLRDSDSSSIQEDPGHTAPSCVHECRHTFSRVDYLQGAVVQGAVVHRACRWSTPHRLHSGGARKIENTHAAHGVFAKSCWLNVPASASARPSSSLIIPAAGSRLIVSVSVSECH
jgi:hypothetical protein